MEIAFDNSSLCCLRNVFHFFIRKSLKSPPWGTGKGKEKEKERARREEEEEEEEEEENVEEEEGVVEKTERPWMERTESLESVGLYLIQVAEQQMSNRGERDGGQD